MNKLNSLYLGCNFDPENECRTDYVNTIYNHCKKLHTLKIRLYIENNDFEFVENMIEEMKQNLLQRTTPLNLIFLD